MPGPVDHQRRRSVVDHGLPGVFWEAGVLSAGSISCGAGAASVSVRPSALAGGAEEAGETRRRGASRGAEQRGRHVGGRSEREADGCHDPPDRVDAGMHPGLSGVAVGARGGDDRHASDGPRRERDEPVCASGEIPPQLERPRASGVSEGDGGPNRRDLAEKWAVGGGRRDPNGGLGLNKVQADRTGQTEGRTVMGRCGASESTVSAAVIRDTDPSSVVGAPGWWLGVKKMEYRIIASR